MQNVNLFLAQYFDGKTVSSPLYATWKNALRFELLAPLASTEDVKQLKTSLQRAIELFEEVFSEGDNMLCVADVTTKENHKFLSDRPLSVYRTFFKEDRVLHQMRHDLVAGPSEESELVTHRLVLPCLRKDMRYETLLEVICHEDIRQPMTNLRQEQSSHYDVYFLNETKGVIFHINEKRHCDIVAADAHYATSLRDKYVAWIPQDDEQNDAIEATERV